MNCWGMMRRTVQWIFVLALFTLTFWQARPMAAQEGEMEAADALISSGSWGFVEFAVPGANIGIKPVIEIHPVTQQPVVIYRDETNKRLNLVQRMPDGGGNCGPGNSWLCQIYTDRNASVTDIAFRGSKSVVTYRQEDGLGWLIDHVEDSKEEKPLAQEEGGRIRDLSVAYAMDNHERLLFDYYGSGLSGSLTALRFLYPTGNTYFDKTVDSTFIAGVSGAQTENGAESSMSISKANKVSIAYRGQAAVNGPVQLKYAEYISGSTKCSSEASPGWLCFIVDPASDSGNNITMHAPQCDNCGDGTRISYYVRSTGQVRFASYTGKDADNCGSGGRQRWKCTVIDSVGQGPTMGVSMAHHNGHPVIAYYDKNDGPNGLLKLARYVGADFLFANCGDGAWYCETVDNGGLHKHDVGQYAAAARDTNGRIYIAYYNATKGTLKIAMEQHNSKPTLSMTVFPGTVEYGTTASVTYTLKNIVKNDVLTGVYFKHQLTDGFRYLSDTPHNNNCGGDVTVSNDKVLFLRTDLGKGQSCTITVQVRAVALGNWAEKTGWLYSIEAQPGTEATANLTVVKANQSITFAALSSRTLGDTPFPVSASASSGLAVSFGSSTTDVCTVNNATVSLKSVGNCTIVASQSGNDTYNAAPNVEHTFAVNQPQTLQAQTISFAPLPNYMLGDVPFTVGASASSGLPVTFSSSTQGVCTVNGVTVTLVTTGVCTIVASQAGNAQYSAAPAVEQSFTVQEVSTGISQLRLFLPVVQR
jgi:hypothetical protein